MFKLINFIVGRHSEFDYYHNFQKRWDRKMSITVLHHIFVTLSKCVGTEDTKCWKVEFFRILAWCASSVAQQFFQGFQLWILSWLYIFSGRRVWTAHVVLSIRDLYQFLMLWRVRGCRSQVFNACFRTWRIRTEISPDSLNFLILWTINNENSKFIAIANWETLFRNCWTVCPYSLSQS